MGVKIKFHFTQSTEIIECFRIYFSLIDNSQAIVIVTYFSINVFLLCTWVQSPKTQPLSSLHYHILHRNLQWTHNELYKELFTTQTSLIHLILFCNFLLKFANKSPPRIKPARRTLWCLEFKRLLWSPTQLSSCISVHLKETRNSPDLFVCFSFGQPSNRWTIMTPAVSSFHSAKTRRYDRCGESCSQPRRCAGLRGRDLTPRAVGEPGQGRLPQVAVVGFGSPSSSFASSRWWVCKWQLTPVLQGLTPRVSASACVNGGAKSMQGGEIKLIKNLLSGHTNCHQKQRKSLLGFLRTSLIFLTG